MKVDRAVVFLRMHMYRHYCPKLLEPRYLSQQLDG